jgi:hypothetical protein
VFVAEKFFQAGLIFPGKDVKQLHLERLKFKKKQCGRDKHSSLFSPPVIYEKSSITLIPGGCKHKTFYGGNQYFITSIHNTLFLL